LSCVLKAAAESINRAPLLASPPVPATEKPAPNWRETSISTSSNAPLTGAVQEDNDSILGGVRTAGSPVPQEEGRGFGRPPRRPLRFSSWAYKKALRPGAARQRTRLGRPGADSMIGLQAHGQHPALRRDRGYRDRTFPGDLIETGVLAGGGATIFMRGALKGIRRHHAHCLGGGPRSRGWPPSGRQTATRPTPATPSTRRAASRSASSRSSTTSSRYGPARRPGQVPRRPGFKDTLAGARPIEKALAGCASTGDLYESTLGRPYRGALPRSSRRRLLPSSTTNGDLVAQCQKADPPTTATPTGITEEIVDIRTSFGGLPGARPP